VVFLADPQVEGDARVARQGVIGALDLVLNDLYFHHVAASLAHDLRPTHTVLLGDLMSSERLTPSELRLRAQRVQRSFGPLFRSTYAINVTGNHDVGYGYEIVSPVLRRFEHEFGPSNSRHIVAGHLVVNVNSMLLEGCEPSLRHETWRFVDDCAKHASLEKLPVILVTHIPLYKQAASRGCDPYVINQSGEYIVEQTHLTELISTHLLEVLNPKLIFTGHDHNGCVHEHVKPDGGTVMEYTVRSVMGDFGGNAMLLTIAKNAATGEPEYTVSTCPLFLRMRDFVFVAGLVVVWLASFIVAPIFRIFVRCCSCCFCRCCRRRQKQAPASTTATTPKQPQEKQPKKKNQHQQQQQQQKQKQQYKQQRPPQQSGNPKRASIKQPGKKEKQY